MIDQVSVRNFRGLAKADLELTEPVTLVLKASELVAFDDWVLALLA